MLYIFDFDFTLIDSSAGIIKSINAGFKNLGLEVPSHEIILNSIGKPLDQSFCEFGGRSSDFDKFLKAFREESDRSMVESALILEDVINVLKHIKENSKNKVAIFSAKDSSTIKKIVKKLSLSEYIDKIVGYDNVTNGKPDNEGISQILNYFSIEKENSIYIGDSLIDFQTAQAAGINFLAVLTGTTSRSMFENAKCRNIAQTLTDAITFLKISI